MTVHTIKIRTEWWERVASGQKVAEVRKLDRDYQVGDLVELVPVREGLLGVLIRDASRGVITAEVGHIVRGGAAGNIGVTAGYGVLSLIEVSVGEPPEPAVEIEDEGKPERLCGATFSTGMNLVYCELAEGHDGRHAQATFTVAPTYAAGDGGRS
ncbi:DUF3850 domain-containing protein [Gordonia malaquae]|uniref:DUF3850 domain-containing protein n=1 Tax=Gordonia malaquae TaxID=410332 RepID=UPI00301A9F0C